MKTNEPIRPSSSWVTVLLIFTLATALSANAQVSYVQFQNNGTQTLRQVNTDGSGDTAITTPFSVLAFPAWSRDRALLALTATDPARPSQVSLNVFTLNPANGSTQNITNFEDKPAPDYQLFFAYHKAFSPDRSLLAVNYIINSRTDKGTSDTPILQIFDANGGGLRGTVHIGPFKDGIHHDGEGVSWSPTQNILATPVAVDSPLQSGGGSGETTAIFIAEPVNNAGNAHQLTFPHADQVVTSTQGYIYGEHDYQPKFSPDGTRVAYVRSFQIAYTSNGGVPSPDVQSLRIIDINTGADTQVIQFQQGLYVTTLDWSPNGSALVFDIGQEASSSGIPAQFVQAGTDQVYLINTDGNGLGQLRGSGSGEPAWEPAAPTQPIVFGNIATRLRVGTGDNAMIGGFIITGNQPKKVLIRGMGPSLANVGVQGVLTDPSLELHQGDPVIATNDNWQEASNTNEIPDGFAPSDPRESVIVTTLQPGNYTAILKGAHGETGIGIVEAYDLTQSATTKFGNISTRGFVDTGDNTMFGGFIINGGSAKVMVRAMGPSLQNVGIANALQDPTLDLVNVNGVVVQSNDNWQQASNTNEIPNGFTPSDPRESVIVTILAPGNYSAIVRGKNNTTGIAIVEAFNLQ
jgi:hypothetical protein